ncbi:unnamed protein product [Caenorhabditis brenneri]
MKCLLILTCLLVLVGADIFSAADFDRYIERTKDMGTKTTVTPEIDAREMKQWGMTVEKPDMSKGTRSCDEKMFLTLLSTCLNQCNNPKNHEKLAKKICDGENVSDSEVQTLCCPDKLKTSA